MAEEIYRIQFRPTASDVDLFRQVRLSSLLQIMQNMATDHANLLGFGGEFMQEHYGAFWLMARTSLSFSQSVSALDELEIHSNHRGAGKGVTIFRDFDFYTKDKHIGNATTSWVIVHTESKKILKPTLFPELLDSPKPQVLKTHIPEKISLPSQLTHKMSRPCFYSDTDINKHMNNTKYADIALDALGFQDFSQSVIQSVDINYLSECFPGQVLQLSTGKQSQENHDTYFVLGKHENEEPCFSFRVTLKPAEQ